MLLGAEKINGDVKGNGNRVESFFPSDHIPSPIEISKSNSYDTTSTKSPPPRPSRNRLSSAPDSGSVSLLPVSNSSRLSDFSQNSFVDKGLIDWANGRLPPNLHFTNISHCGGLHLMRIAESIKGRPASPPVSDSSFPFGPNDDTVDGIIVLFEFLLDNDVHLGTVSINDLRRGKKEKIVQVLKALKSWEDKRAEISQFLNASAGFVYNSNPYPSTAGAGAWTPVM